jgi:hypothetical protein
MAETLEIYNNGIRVIIEDNVVPIQLIFKNERNEITGHSIVSIEQLKKILVAAEDEFSWHRAVVYAQKIAN